MAEHEGGGEVQGQARSREAHRRAPRRCASLSGFTGVAKAFKTPSSDRFHWYVLAEVEDLDCVVEYLDEDLGSADDL